MLSLGYISKLYSNYYFGIQCFKYKDIFLEWDLQDMYSISFLNQQIFIPIFSKNSANES